MNKLVPVFRTLAQVAVAAVIAFLAVHFGLSVDPATATALVGGLTAVLTVAVTAAQQFVERKFPQIGAALHTPAYPAEVAAAVAAAEDSIVAEIVQRLSEAHVEQTAKAAVLAGEPPVVEAAPAAPVDPPSASPAA